MHVAKTMHVPAKIEKTNTINTNNNQITSNDYKIPINTLSRRMNIYLVGYIDGLFLHAACFVCWLIDA